MQAPDKNSKYTFLSRLEHRPRGSTLEQVEQSLRTSIISLDFAPGELIDKRAVCARLGVSMFPVSEALARLAVEGLVEVLPQRGTRVTRIHLRVIREFMLIRQALEELVAATAALHLSPSGLDVLRSNLKAQEQAVARMDPSGFHNLDLDFHNTLVVLLCHKHCVAAGTSWELSHESADEFSPDGGDRLGDVAFGADGRSHEAGPRSTGGTLCRLCGG
jgi:GntR family transcriptional regulator, rspAB operon transcriptional repressor